jgi:hypothetical protein
VEESAPANTSETRQPAALNAPPAPVPPAPQQIVLPDVRPEQPQAPQSPSGTLGVVDAAPPQAPVQRAQAPRLAATSPFANVLPSTGEPLVDLGIVTLALLGLTLLGMRFLRSSARRA